MPVYIQYLNYLMKDIRPDSHEFTILQTKIKNANKLAIEINKKHPLL